MASSITPPLVARSNDGSLIGIHQPPSSSSNNSNNNKSGGGLIRCYDGSVSNGSLKFTLRVPASSASNANAMEANNEEEESSLNKLVFASNNRNGSPSHLCGMHSPSASSASSSSSSVLVWDLDRGVLSQTINVRAASAGVTASAKKKRKSISSGEGKEVLCDVATSGDQLYALVFFPDSEGNGGGKCRVYQYDLSADEATLKRKIKVGSVPAVPSDDDSSSVVVFGIAISASSSTMAIRMGNQLRALDLASGEKLCKMDIPSEVISSSNSNSEEEDESTFVPLSITPNGKYIVSGINGNQAIVFSCTKEKDAHKGQVVGLLSSKDNDSPITHLDLTLDDDDNLTVLTFQPEVGIASLFDASTIEAGAEILTPTMPRAQLKADSSSFFIGAGFHPRKPDETLVLMFQKSRSKSGSASGSGTSLPMESLDYDGLEGTVTVGTSLSVKDDKSKDGKKRKAGDSIALAPGDQGREASLASDLTSGKKKTKAEGAENEDDFADMEEEGEQGQSIAERLALLSSAMEQTDDESGSGEDDDDDEDEEESKAQKSSFKLKSATSETLTTLLTQALSSNDMTQLNIALQVTDRRLVEGTVRSLQAMDAERRATDQTTKEESYISMLMAHVVRRMARRHSLVMPLGVWVKAILAATARSYTANSSTGAPAAVQEQMAKEGREMAMKLGPLKNFLNERVESFPMLLRLEGRLALLSQQQQL